MDTDELIRALAADSRSRGAPLSFVWWVAAALTVALAAAVFLITLHPRPDLAAVTDTPRFLSKFLVMLTQAGGAFGALRALSRPEGNLRNALPLLIAAPALLLAAVALELLVVPPEAWLERVIGTSNVYCLILIIMLGLGPLSILLLALRHGAPSNPGIAGAVVGLLAGGIAATIYAVHCVDDSPLFVVTWYTLAIAALAALGAITARRFVRW
jgi:hypothetical protein